MTPGRVLLLLLALAFVLAACGEAGASGAPSGTTEPSPTVDEPASGGTDEPSPDEASPPDEASGAEAAPDEAAEAASPAPIPDDLCERARACCAAYVAAIPVARRALEERACSEMDRVLGEAGEATDEACEAAIGGWRQSLQLTGLDVPPACAE